MAVLFYCFPIQHFLTFDVQNENNRIDHINNLDYDYSIKNRSDRPRTGGRYDEKFNRNKNTGKDECLDA